MNNLTKIAALPTGGGCQSALRPEDRGAERAVSVAGMDVQDGRVITVTSDGAAECSVLANTFYVEIKATVTDEEWEGIMATWRQRGGGWDRLGISGEGAC